MMKKLILILLILSTSCTIPPKPKTGWERYKHSTLNQVTTYFANDTIVKEENTVRIVGADAPFLTEVYYLDSIRDISEIKRICIEGWIKVRGAKIEVDFFATKEILVDQNDIKYWMIIQNKLLPDLTAGEYQNPLLIYFQYAGIVFENNNVEWVFIINRWDG